jgi:Flp pilus assembly protein TadB
MTSSSQPWGRGRPGRRPWEPDPRQRVSDAERSDVAERLSKHYSDGRLDQAEFNERLDKAMKAKTRADLSGLLDDLPGGGPVETAVRQQHHRHPRFLFFALVVVVAVLAAQAVAHWFWPLLLIAVLVVVLLRFGPGHQHSHRHDHDPE